jgi:25S rRNA (adenine2142-N1)-methyltransferase
MQMDREEEWEGEIGYDVVSLSLVVNYVPEPKGRGDMLRHSARFLRQGMHPKLPGSKMYDMLPALFLVLPLPCLDNSRYLTEEKLKSIMASLGYEISKVKRSGKLYYSLWRLNRHGSVSSGAAQQTSFKKEELRKGKDRNNFCIVLEPG